jgi:hypothetical protein
VAEFEDKQAAGFEVTRGFGDKHSVKFVAFFAPVKSCWWLVVADFDWKQGRFATAHIRRIGND